MTIFATNLQPDQPFIEIYVRHALHWLTLLTFLNIIITPHYLRTQLYHHLVAVRSVDLTNGHILTYIAIYLLPDWFLNGEAGRQRHLSMYANLQVKEVSTSSSIDYLTGISTEMQRRLSTDTNWQWRYLSLSNSIHQYSPIDRSINQLINISTDIKKLTEGHIIRTLDIRTHYLTDL